MEAYAHICCGRDHGVAVYDAHAKHTTSCEGLIMSISPWFSDTVPLLFSFHIIRSRRSSRLREVEADATTGQVARDGEKGRKTFKRRWPAIRRECVRIPGDTSCWLPYERDK
jgi:hypothetical protein